MGCSNPFFGTLFLLLYECKGKADTKENFLPSVKEDKVMGIIDLIMGWGVASEEVSDAEFEALAKADKKTKKSN